MNSKLKCPAENYFSTVILEILAGSNSDNVAYEPLRFVICISVHYIGQLVKIHQNFRFLIPVGIFIAKFPSFFVVTCGHVNMPHSVEIWPAHALHTRPAFIKCLEDLIRKRSFLKIREVLFQLLRAACPDDNGITMLLTQQRMVCYPS